MHTYNCNGFIVKLTPVGSSWEIQTSGDVPRNVKKGLDELKAKRPRPDLIVAHTIIKSVCGCLLNYVSLT